MLYIRLRHLVCSFVVLLCLSCGSLSTPVSAGPPTAPSIDVFFSPRGGATEAVVRELGNAKKEILVQAYSFTSAPIAKALVDAHKRGVKVTVVLDKSQRTAKYSSATFLSNIGIPTHIDAKHAIAHNKIMIIDQATIITGSFNFTKQAEEKNAENLLVIRGDDALVKKYIANFDEHLGHSEKYEGR
ncbi:MAG: phospholipase D family protein [Deltaproteobacteria bacterium]|nr:MAG: phospholipase D family protein [Deltaproteobacteria bacterium]